MVSEIGFDGVHLDAEIVHDQDSAFIELLQAVRPALTRGAILSTIANPLQLTQSVTSFPYPVLPSHWSTDYLRLVASNSDQVALMAYDSGLFFPSDYRSWMAYQVETGGQAVEGLETDFLIGLPTSEEWTPSHQTPTEYLGNALYGLRGGISGARQP